MEKSWQISYIVDDLIVPKEGIHVNENIFVKRGEHIHEAVVFIKITKDEYDKEGFPRKEVLDNILKIFALETLRYTRTSYGRIFIKTPINEKIPYGLRPISRIPINMQYTSKQLDALYHAVNYAVEEYSEVHELFEDRNRKSTRIAIEYFYKALGEHDVKKRLVDLVVALESFFSGGPEIRYKVSLRIAILLGFIGINKKDVFETVYDLYDKRSKIVHGRGDIKVTWKELYQFEMYLQDCCRIFLYLDEDKDTINKMLDKSLLDDEVKNALSEIILTAYNKWKKSKFDDFKIPLPRQTLPQASIVFEPK